MKKDFGFHCSQHGAVGQGVKNGRCELCWPPKPITTIEQVIDLLEVERDEADRAGLKGRAEDFQKIIDHIKD